MQDGREQQSARSPHARTRAAPQWPEPGNRFALRRQAFRFADHRRTAIALFQSRAKQSRGRYPRLSRASAKRTRSGFRVGLRIGRLSTPSRRRGVEAGRSQLPMPSTQQNPLALVAELTHRCPLHCVYCSNPLELQSRSSELTTETWSRVFREAAEAGVLQADFTGGEPLARPDIVELIRNARAAGLYVSLITSGLPLDEAKLEALVEAGLDHFQLSFQGAREETTNDISGTKSHRQKLRVLEWLKRYRIGLTLNFVIHRRNIDELEEMLAIVEDSGAGCVEFASVQYY